MLDDRFFNKQIFNKQNLVYRLVERRVSNEYFTAVYQTCSVVIKSFRFFFFFFLRNNPFRFLGGHEIKHLRAVIYREKFSSLIDGR